MTRIRRLAYAALLVAVLQIIFGGIVRISGSGLGCGEHWPTCYGHWIPPFSQPAMVIEWTHRLIAATLLVVLVIFAAAAWGSRREIGVPGRGGVLRAAWWSLGLWFAPAIVGAITVWLGTPPFVTVLHWLLAAALLATIAGAVIRAGGLGGFRARLERATPKTARGAYAAAAIALVVVLLGGLTANIPGANLACQGFPLCRGGLIPNPAQHLQLTHRILAYLLFLHVLGLMIAVAKRREAPVVVRTARIAFGALVLQVIIAAAMVELYLPPALRSLHQTVGALIWLSLFTLAYLARIASGKSAVLPLTRVDAHDPAFAAGGGAPPIPPIAIPPEGAR